MTPTNVFYPDRDGTLLPVVKMLDSDGEETGDSRLAVVVWVRHGNGWIVEQIVDVPLVIGTPPR
jgi:hypothetical protein